MFVFVPLFTEPTPPLTRAVHQAWSDLDTTCASGRTLCAGDPVNRRDPRGEAASVSKSGVIIGIKPSGARYRYGAGYGQESEQHRIEVQSMLETDKDLTEADVKSIMARAGLKYGATSFPCPPGQTCMTAAAPNHRGDAALGAGLAVANSVNTLLAPVNEVNGEEPFPTPDPENEQQRTAYGRTNDVIEAVTVPAALAGLVNGLTRLPPQAQVVANRIAGAQAVDDFIAQAEANGIEVVGREVSVQTPFGIRRYDVVIRDAAGSLYGIEIKSSTGAFTRFDAAARQQFAADRWVNQYGADAIGQHAGIGRIQGTTKILWKGN